MGTSPLPDTDRRDAVAAEATPLLAELAGAGAQLRDDQATAIAALVDGGTRVLCVQRTGWGKSAVYFLATALRRARGAGPTLLVSPLLALMRDQVAAAERAGIRAASIDSTNREVWDEVLARVDADEIDLLLVSPERLAHPDFRDGALGDVAARAGMVVVDEAHCISDWGHDFRPDYRRIHDALATLDASVPVLATTATANARVTADVADQLADGDPTRVVTLRGGLDRESLRLDCRESASAAERMAWLAEWIPTVDGTGIVYTLTVADAERVAAFLASEGLAAEAYTGQSPADERARVEAALSADEVDVVVATTALSMGYDKGDLAFIAHYGLPASSVAYYQAIGRAGRTVDNAWVVALPGPHDEDVWQHFATQAMPSQRQVAEVVDAVTDLNRDGDPASIPQIERVVNMRRTKLELILKVADVDGAVRRVRGGWEATGRTWRPDHDRIERVRAAREAEADAMRAYAASDTCLMSRLRSELDDLDGADPADPAVACGRCARCTGHRIGPGRPSPDTVTRAQRALRQAANPIPARRQWPSGALGRDGRELRGRLAHPHAGGRALALGADHGWDAPLDVLLDYHGDPTADGAPSEVSAAFDEVCGGLAAMLAEWQWPQRPTWVCAVPSRSRPFLTVRVANRLAALGKLHRADVLTRADDTPPQRSSANSAQQAGAADAAWADVTATLPQGPCLLVDDVTHSGWTLAVTADRLSAAGCELVLPVALLRQP